MTNFEKALEYVKKEFRGMRIEQQSRIAQKMIDSGYSWVAKIINEVEK